MSGQDLSRSELGRLHAGATIAFLSHLDFNLSRFRLPLMKELESKGISVWALTPDGNSEFWSHHRIHHRAYALRRGSMSVQANLRAAFEVSLHVRDISPDILHTFTIQPAVVGSIAARINRVRMIASITGLGSMMGADIETADAGIQTRLVRGVARVAMRTANRVLFQNSEDLEWCLHRNYVSADAATIIGSSGVDTSYFAPETVSAQTKRALRRSLGISDDDVLAVCVARLLADKGILELKSAMELVQNSRLFCAVVGGEDPGNPRSLSLSELRTDGGRTYFVGEQLDVRSWLAAADIFVLPSYREGVPRSTLEAMSMGLPVVSTAVAGCRETVIPKQNGILVPAKSAGPLADALDTLASDRSLRLAMGSAGRALALERFDVQVAIQRHMAIYASVLGS